MPLRVAMETAGFSVGFDSQNSTAIIITEHSRIEVPIGQNRMYVGNNRVYMDTAAIVHNGRTFLPIRPILEAANFTVEWHAPTSTINSFLFDWHEDMYVSVGTTDLGWLLENLLNEMLYAIKGA